MTARPEPNHLVMLNLFQHLVCFFLPSADTSFIPVHRTGFSDALLIKMRIITVDHLLLEIVKPAVFLSKLDHPLYTLCLNLFIIDL